VGKPIFTINASVFFVVPQKMKIHPYREQTPFSDYFDTHTASRSVNNKEESGEKFRGSDKMTYYKKINDFE
jgi:hypothetical protein